MVDLADQGDLVVRMSSADRRYLLDRVGGYLRTLGWLLFWLALVFYFQITRSTQPNKIIQSVAIHIGDSHGDATV